MNADEINQPRIDTIFPRIPWGYPPRQNNPRLVDLVIYRPVSRPSLSDRLIAQLILFRAARGSARPSSTTEIDACALEIMRLFSRISMEFSLGPTIVSSASQVQCAGGGTLDGGTGSMSLPTTDQFSYTRPGSPSIPSGWRMCCLISRISPIRLLYQSSFGREQ